MFSCSADALETPRGGACLCHSPEIISLTRRMTAQVSRRSFMAGLATSAANLGVQATAAAQSQTATSRGSILFTNVRLFDGVSPTLRDNMQVLVEGNTIKAVRQGGGAAQGAQTIDGGGRVLMPGLIDAHTHLIFATVPLQVTLSADPNYLMLRAGQAAAAFLMQGFTSARDNGELLALSGPRNPYPGKLGVIASDALADLLLVDGDPLADIALIANPQKNFRIIMKDGRIYKNTL